MGFGWLFGKFPVQMLQIINSKIIKAISHHYDGLHNLIQSTVHVHNNFYYLTEIIFISVFIHTYNNTCIQ